MVISLFLQILALHQNLLLKTNFSIRCVNKILLVTTTKLLAMLQELPLHYPDRVKNSQNIHDCMHKFGLIGSFLNLS